MPVFRIDLAYDGSGFRGYARQQGHRTVQGDLERALGLVLGQVPATSVAGRTDAGVHARAQVVSFSFERPIDTEAVARSLNGILGPEVAVTGLTQAPEGFSARHSAVWRRYRYRMSTATAADPLTRGHTWHVGQGIDLAAMEVAAAHFLGEHDFTSFCRTVEGRSNVRRVDESSLLVNGEIVEYWVRANAFCHQMVRSLVGHLYDVGRGFVRAEDVPDVIAAHDRGRVATVAPPHGLTLWEVGY